MKKVEILSNNMLKLLAAVCMTIDHIGMIIYPDMIAFRVIGRIAFPIFAYMLAEGAKHTRNKLIYLARILIVGLICQIVYYLALDSLEQCIFITFSLSLFTIIVLDLAIKKKRITWILLAILVVCIDVFLCIGLPRIIKDSNFSLDYGIIGVFTPVVMFLIKNKYIKLGALTLILIVYICMRGWYAVSCLIAIPLLAMYNGKRGKLRMGYFYYLYYPIHLAVIFLMSLIL